MAGVSPIHRRFDATETLEMLCSEKNKRWKRLYGLVGGDGIGLIAGPGVSSRPTNTAGPPENDMWQRLTGACTEHLFGGKP